MIVHYTPNQPSIALESDLAGEFPLYLYWSEDKSTFLYSKSITELLDDARVPKPLKVSIEGLSFLLQSGVVPPPKTAYENIYILSVGNKASVSTVNNKIDIKFSNEFPFYNSNRFDFKEIKPDETYITQLLAEVTINRLDESKQSFLFHSAGKDSNSIALALAEAGWQNKVTLITHKTKGINDESHISKEIAKKLGFKHEVLIEQILLSNDYKVIAQDYFLNLPFPSTDSVTLAYPSYVNQLPMLKGSNIIDGMGNDVYMGHIPTRSEYTRQQLSVYLKYLRVLSKKCHTTSRLNVIGRTRSECTGMSGLSFKDSGKVLKDSQDISKYWLAKDNDDDYLDFRALIRGAVIDTEIFTRKARNFADSIGANLVLPWANKELALYFSKMPAEFLFNRKELRNKLVLRNLIKKIGIDSNQLGKYGFTFDYKSLVVNNLSWMVQEIKSCNYWNSSSMNIYLEDLVKILSGSGRGASVAASTIHRIFLLSAWLNNCKYIN
ncbi:MULTISPECIES: hypothetical protein [unclassified Marinobacterium]|uniref:hypothetical protein n=1 Tax=unclassified Marinobacterium TaxID=2644139 RepID=UPI0015680990|nr:MULTISPECIES: hypothetical protein [unclassified Marinobacterium]NRP09209.1 hypothetical protein [Marinobacterium sp. xm-g-48]NRP82260.1 hypothetical protein [Marinobacterium sp. xm-d-509]